jgi:hypothetical protein
MVEEFDDIFFAAGFCQLVQRLGLASLSLSLTGAGTDNQLARKLA